MVMKRLPYRYKSLSPIRFVVFTLSALFMLSAFFRTTSYDLCFMPDMTKLKVMPKNQPGPAVAYKLTR